MSTSLTEFVVEEAALAWLESLGYAVLHGPDISPGGDVLTPALCALTLIPSPGGRGRRAEARYARTLSLWEREKYSDVVLEGRLCDARQHVSCSYLFTRQWLDS